MKTNYCQTCKRKPCPYTIADDCPFLRKELNRITNGRKKQPILIPETALNKNHAILWQNVIYGKYEDD